MQFYVIETVRVGQILTKSHSEETRESRIIKYFFVHNTSHLEGMEEGLARARAAIQEAVRIQRYISHKNESFIPRGSIYKNPYAFHQL
ncbi:unnamed protein product [Ilex paraguariensis]|uniref:Uncharacterized protein n=1 Tax=Ilex paraguariensis TaxID=185542 RepID=A0ABC8T352_9AQUA